ncbi:glycosyltransferase family 2 protein [Millisia brevis]|uniref:glycosyltransferase family 2 protein n=1 Tax=Millisia brevis TaxID=264148 RepID=UPI00083377F8|nr:glycosyltransferase family 2 protein [Millisia brevis]
MAPLLSVVVPAYNEEDTITDCLDRLTDQLEHIREIVVVNNNSTDRTVDLVECIAERHPQVRLINEAQQGLVYARCAGMDSAIGDLIARIDADTLVRPGWARTIVEFFRDDTDDRWSALCGRGEAYGVPLSGRFEKWKIALHPLGDRRVGRAVKEVPVLYGSNMVIRREVWKRIRDRVSMRRDVFEDVDVGLCVNDIGGRNAFLGTLTVGVSPRRMETGLRDFAGYMSCLPRTFLLHRRFGFAAGAALIYVPTLVVLHAGRLVAIRVYDDRTGRFTTSRPRRQTSSRVRP